MAELSELREQIDAVDEEMFRLFAQRMAISLQIADAKRAMGKAVLDPEREQEKIRSAREQVPEGLEEEAQALMEVLMASSRRVQTKASNGIEGC